MSKASCSQPCNLQAARDAGKQRSRQQGCGQAGARSRQGGFWQHQSHPLCAAWTVSPALPDPHTVEADSKSLKAILSSERSLGAHQPGWTRALRWGRSLERGSRGRSLEQRRARTSAAIGPKAAVEKAFQTVGSQCLVRSRISEVFDD